MLAAEQAVNDLTTGEYLTQWLDHMRGRVRATTYEGYAGLIRLYARPALGETPLSELHPLHIQETYGELLRRGLSGGTVLNLHLVLTQALHQAVRWGLRGSNPATSAQPPRPSRAEPYVVDEDLARRILAALGGTSVELPAAVALGTGMRRGEILALRWGDLDPGFLVAQVRRTLENTSGGIRFAPPKTKRSRRTVALPEFLRPFLERQRGDQADRRAFFAEHWREGDLIVDDGDGRPVNPRTMSSRWRFFVRRAGLPPIRFHDLRHAHATLMLLQGVHPKVVSERLGHASVGITLDLYSHVLPSMQTEAARAFDRLFPSDGAPRP